MDSTPISLDFLWSVHHRRPPKYCLRQFVVVLRLRLSPSVRPSSLQTSILSAEPSPEEVLAALEKSGQLEGVMGQEGSRLSPLDISEDMIDTFEEEISRQLPTETQLFKLPMKALRRMGSKMKVSTKGLESKRAIVAKFREAGFVRPEALLDAPERRKRERRRRLAEEKAAKEEEEARERALMMGDPLEIVRQQMVKARQKKREEQKGPVGGFDDETEDAEIQAEGQEGKEKSTGWGFPSSLSPTQTEKPEKGSKSETAEPLGVKWDSSVSPDELAALQATWARMEKKERRQKRGKMFFASSLDEEGEEDEDEEDDEEEEEDLPPLPSPTFFEDDDIDLVEGGEIRTDGPKDSALEALQKGILRDRKGMDRPSPGSVSPSSPTNSSTAASTEELESNGRALATLLLDSKKKEGESQRGREKPTATSPETETERDRKGEIDEPISLKAEKLGVKGVGGTVEYGLKDFLALNEVDVENPEDEASESEWEEMITRFARDKTSFRCGFVTIVGTPNVGKSTLMNACLGESLSIVSPKAQTTRHRVVGICTDSDSQFVFSDTPGLLRPKYAMHEAMMGFARSACRDAEVLLLVTDVFQKPADFPLEDVLERLRSFDGPVLLGLNKCDLLNEVEDDPALYGAVVVPEGKGRPGESVGGGAGESEFGLEEEFHEAFKEKLEEIQTEREGGGDTQGGGEEEDPMMKVARSLGVLQEEEESSEAVEEQGVAEAQETDTESKASGDAKGDGKVGGEATKETPESPRKKSFFRLLAEWHLEVPNAIILPLSAKEGKNVETLKGAIKRRLPYGPPLFPPDQRSEQSLRFFSAEIIRREILQQYTKEIPYSVEVVIRTFSETEDQTAIEAVITCLRDSQQKILIGAEGRNIKTLGMRARLGLEDFLGKKVKLSLRVKVSKDWRDDQKSLARYGYFDDYQKSAV
uniref:Era-type G domain-containing protein n=1 Tax=Chromera velia CCMP2878 TaxID=1169474 RepID=A0A0G4F384_9ALVE|eukprot:Cvel_14935.t1-p1 / transcript=Cvel_14935.t1 / gene=Cvel_14935 / organism=Chromera_velia_CCMP2878 / gene_product=GTPase Era, putative / transcript_product=GTPase Era, putative / location=Cvel_scaffold1083:29605-36708(-) / protein_length=929 / sequence_SO=supercontig / SO=protein_coding / is_pseudo=false